MTEKKKIEKHNIKDTLTDNQRNKIYKLYIIQN